MKQSDNLIEVKDLSIAFPKQNTINTVVDSISISIKHGEILGVVGESGSGKSQTALSLMGLCPPNAIISNKKSINFFSSSESAPIQLLSLPAKQLQKLEAKIYQ